MPISTVTFPKSVGWARSDVINQLENAFTYLGWHGGQISGIVTGIVGVQTGGNYGPGIATYHYDVRQTSTSGVGTGASFDFYRGTGLITQIWVNRPGVGYTDGEVVQISANSIGGSVNGAVGIALTVKVAGNASPTGFGSTSRFFVRDYTGTYPWGVQRHTIQANKRYGDVYRIFYPTSNTNLKIQAGSSFHPGGPNMSDTTNNLGMGYTMTLRGNQNLDLSSISGNAPATNGYQVSSAADYFGNQSLANLTYASSNSYILDLNLFRSGIDPNFVVFSYRQPNLSSTILTDNTFDTFILHNFTSTLWDYDYVYLGGMTTIIPTAGNTGSPQLTFRTFLTSTAGGSSYGPRRTAEYGFLGISNGGYNPLTYVDYVVQSNTYPQQGQSYNSRIYARNSSPGSGLQYKALGGYNSTADRVDTGANFNAVIKSLPLNGNLLPVPYYIPDDFVLIDFDYASPNANIQQGDTITISGSEVYKVITGSYNQTTADSIMPARTRGILFCGRVV